MEFSTIRQSEFMDGIFDFHWDALWNVIMQMSFAFILLYVCLT